MVHDHGKLKGVWYEDGMCKCDYMFEAHKPCNPSILYCELGTLCSTKQPYALS